MSAPKDAVLRDRACADGRADLSPAWNRALHLAAGLSLAVTLIALLLYVGHFFKPDFSSDDAVLNLLAEAMHRQGRVLPEGWVGNNGDLMVPSGALLIAPLLAWWPNGFGAHAFASIVLSLALLAAAGWLLRLARVSWTATAVALTVLASGFAFQFTIMVFGQTTYVWWPAGFLAGAALLILHDRTVRLGSRAGWTRNAPLVWLAILVAVIAFANPGRVAIMMVLPLYAFERVLAAARKPIGISWLRRLSPTSAASIVLIAAWCVSLLGYRIAFGLGTVSTHHAVSNLQLTDWPGFVEHVRIFANGWFDYLGGSSRGFEHKPWEPLMRTLRTLLAVALTSVAVLELRDWKRHADPLRRALLIAFFAAWLPVLALFLLFDPLAQPSSVSLRYFSVAFFILAMLGAWRIDDALRTVTRWGAGALIAGCVLIAGGTVYRMIPFGPTFWTTRASPAMNLAQTLQREGLSWGYATWWNAGATTVLADGAVHVHPIALSPQLLHAYPAMVDRSWYRPDAHAGPTFLALAAAQADAAQLAFLEARLGSPVRTIDEAGYRIQVYDRNIAADLTCIEPADPLDAALDASEFRALRVVSAALAERPAGHRGPAGLRVRVRNDTTRPIGSTGLHPITVGVHLADAQGRTTAYDWLHAPLDCPLAPGEERVVGFMLPDAPAGPHRITIDLVQEGVAWFADKGADTITLPLETP